MGTMVDVDDLLDATGVAQLLGISQRSNVSVYRRRNPDFPEPIRVFGSGRCPVWLRTDIEEWRLLHPGRSV